MDEVKPDRQLKGKTNFISWKREFERAARANDVLEFLTGEEVVPPKPNKDEYFVKVLDTETRRSTRIKKSLSPTTDDENETDDGQAVIDDCADAKEAYEFIKKRYAVTNERARDILLNRLHDLKLDHCESVTDYTNQVRQIKADLKTVKYDMTDDMFATALLHGLPPSYRSFKEKYDWIRSTKPDDSPDLDYLFERMHVEETQQLQMKEERKARDKAKRDATNSSTMNIDNPTRYRPRREDRNHLKCTYPSCGKTGHSEDNCWVKNPEKIPRSLKEKFTNTTNRAVVNNDMGGVAEMNLNDSKDTYTRTDALGTGPRPSTHAKPADPSPQMHRAMSCIKLRRSGGVDMGDPVSATLGFSKPVLGAFLAGSFCTTDTWLADTGANMHIVNDMKWFKKDTFRPSNLKISTADGSTTLEIEGTGVVNLVLKSPDGFPVKASLSEVAYAPRGKCNLFSGGMFTQRAKVTGIYNEQYMTWMNDAGHMIGYAIFGNGLYHLDAAQLPSDNMTGGVIAAAVDFDDPVWKWHRRLGHLGFQNMLNLLRSSTGMEITEKQIKAKLKAVCPVCATTRALVKIPRDPASRHAQQPGAMVHMDVWGPYPIEGFDGTRYFLFITDDCTRYTWSARFDKKYQLFEVFKSLVKLIQKVFNITIRCCRFDTEFERGPIGKWCSSHSIAREPIEPYAHYQNGVAERTNRTIREKAAPMVQETSISGQVSKIISEKGNELLRISKIPENLWPEAIQHAVWLKNRTPARALRKKDAKTPYEALRGIKPTLTRERIWGSRAYVTYPQELRNTAEMTKLHNPRGWLGYFVGCESEAIYHIYSPEKHKVYRIGVARIEDGEGLHDPHDAPCLEDRIPTPDVTDNNHSVDGSEASSDSYSDHDDGESGHDQHTVISSDEEIADQEDHVSGSAHESQDEVEDADDEDETDNGSLGPKHVSKYFNQPKHAGMAKRKFPDDPIIAPRKSRRATHGQRDINLEHSDSDLSDLNDDSWYYSEDGKTSQSYWQFVAKHGGNHMKNFLPNDDKCDRCFRNGRKCDSAENGTPCLTCRNDNQACKPQSKETKKLILPENRHKRKEIGKVQQNQPCRRCFQTNRTCYLIDSSNLHCEACQKAKLNCNWNLDGAKKSTAQQKRRQAEKEEKHKKLGFAPVPRDQKCYRVYHVDDKGSMICPHVTNAVTTADGIFFDGTFESWAIRPFELKSLGEPNLREDYEKYTGRRKSRIAGNIHELGKKPDKRRKKEVELAPSVGRETIDTDLDEKEANTGHDVAKSDHKEFKFGLSAYGGHTVPALQLKTDKTFCAKYHQAKMEELKSHEEKGTWTIVPLEKGVKPVTSRWVTTDKYGADGNFTRHKARLVARGFQQEEGIDYEETFASVVKSASTRILLALAAICHWHIHQGDVKTAFLNSDLDKPVYMRPPSDVKLARGCCLLLLKALYGLKQSPRAWYQKLRDTLARWGWRMSAYDPCVFINDTIGLILEVHVDDINVMGKNLQTILDFKAQFSKEFPISDEGECSWYLGMHIEQKPGEIHLHQKQYIDQMVNKYGFKDAAPVKTPLDTKIKLAKQGDYVANAKFRKENQSKVGSLNISSNQTRPDIAFATGYVARYSSNPNRAHMDAVDRIFAYLKSDARKGIVFSDKHGLQLRGFVDSDFAGCEDSRKSTTGWVFTLAGGPISWSSQRQKTVATSTMDAEYIACAEAAKEAMWIRNFINDLRIPGVHTDKVPLYIDNNAALKLTRNPEFHSRAKHIDVKHNFIREKVEEGLIDTQRVNTKDNLADVFTKALPRSTHEDLVGRLNLHSGGGVESAISFKEGSKTARSNSGILEVPRPLRVLGTGGELDPRSRDMYRSVGVAAC
ncbi:Integrase, catalytic core [Penicillium italicum]|uniref:Integrase, catalytic core n=1 Tax=Penicillium italicum TaxID=40296 RepID=A0A0A2KQT4_PENIT|nr:Integrase, catalytic core [Penicillium italicum]